MHAENSVVDQGCDWQTVETVDKSFPEFDVVSSFALLLKNAYIRHKIRKFC
jgi:hypothetical protein